MKKQDVVNVVNSLKEIKTIGDKQDYLTSQAINQQYLQAMDYLNKELERMDKEGIEINHPYLWTIEQISDSSNILEAKTKIKETLNDELEEFILNDYKIIDYGITTTAIEDTWFFEAYIKYTE